MKLVSSNGMNDLQRALLEILVLDVQPEFDYDLDGHPIYSESRPPQGDDPERHQIAWAYITRDAKPGEIDAAIANIQRREQARYEAMRRQLESERRERPEPSPIVVPQNVRDQVTSAISQAREYLDKFASSTLSSSVSGQLHGANSALSQCYRADSWTLDKQVKVSNALAAGVEYLQSRTQAPTIRDSVVAQLRTVRSILSSSEWDGDGAAAEHQSAT